MGEILKYKAVEETAIQKHNKRVKSMREVRLAKNVVASIDDVIRTGDRMVDALTASLCTGKNQISMQDCLELSNAIQTLKVNFTEIDQ
jgi:phosphoribosylformylglycinamidine (FGAM) synthase-like enzyme